MRARLLTPRGVVVERLASGPNRESLAATLPSGTAADASAWYWRGAWPCGRARLRHRPPQLTAIRAVVVSWTFLIPGSSSRGCFTDRPSSGYGNADQPIRWHDFWVIYGRRRCSSHGVSAPR
jgi:hypothetical protein